MNLLKVCTCRLFFTAMLGIFSLGGVSDVAAIEIFSPRSSNDCCQATQQCDCQQCDCSDDAAKDNLFKQSMRVLMGRLHSLLSSKAGCDETPCDDACDAMMLEELIEIQNSAEVDSDAPVPSHSDQIDVHQTNKPPQATRLLPVVILSPLDGVTAAAMDAKPLVSDRLEPSDRRLEPSDRRLEDLPRGRVRAVSPRVSVPVPFEQSKATVIPPPIRTEAGLELSNDDF